MFPQIILLTMFYYVSWSISFFIIYINFTLLTMEKSSSLERLKTQADLCDAEDAAIVYKLRRSCAKIEQLRMEVDTLRRENDMKNKLIINLQSKERELNRLIQSLRQSIEIQGISTKNQFQKQIVMKTKDDQIMILEQQYKKLQIRYSNCEQQNIFLRSELKGKQKQIYLLQQALIIRNMQFRDVKEDGAKLQEEMLCLRKENAYLTDYVGQLELLASSRLEDSLKSKEELCHYQEMLGICSVEMREAIAQKRELLYNFQDLNSTVDHIEQLRSIFRNKRKVCK